MGARRDMGARSSLDMGARRDIQCGARGEHRVGAAWVAGDTKVLHSTIFTTYWLLD